jgi:ABC-2 type transport system ATP-binding protein
MSDSPVLACKGLGASYEGREIFHSLDCALATGIHALRGTNGIGKSTLLRLLAGAQPADAGRVWIDGIDLMQAPRAAKRRLSYVPDESPIYPFMTGEELLHFVAAAKRTGIDATVNGLIAAFDLPQHLHTRFDSMSLGTRKKMMLCAAWIGAPKVLLVDEPSNGLDLASRDHLFRLLRYWGHERTILFATHDEEFVSACGAAVIEMRSLLDSSASACHSLGSAIDTRATWTPRWSRSR